MDTIEKMLKERERKHRINWAYTHGCLIIIVSILLFIIVMSYA